MFKMGEKGSGGRTTEAVMKPLQGTPMLDNAQE
jgi:hypothetical protein